MRISTRLLWLPRRVEVSVHPAMNQSSVWRFWHPHRCPFIAVITCGFLWHRLRRSNTVSLVQCPSLPLDLEPTFHRGYLCSPALMLRYPFFCLFLSLWIASFVFATPKLIHPLYLLFPEPDVKEPQELCPSLIDLTNVFSLRVGRSWFFHDNRPVHMGRWIYAPGEEQGSLPGGVWIRSRWFHGNLAQRCVVS